MLHALETVRSGMPSARHAVYLNAGTWGPLPTRAADAMRARVDSVEASGRIGTSGYEQFQAHPRGRARGVRRGDLERARAHRADALDERRHEPRARRPRVRVRRRGHHDRQRARGAARAAGGAAAPLRHRGARRGGAARRRCRRCRRVADRPAHEARGALARALGERARPAAAGDLGRRARGRRAGARGRGAGCGRDRRRSRGARRRRVRGPRAEVAVRAERRRLPVGRRRLRGSLRGRRSELLHARLPQRGRAVLARRAAPRRRLALERRAGRSERGRGLPARARRLERGRRAHGRACGRAASSCSRTCRA